MSTTNGQSSQVKNSNRGEEAQKKKQDALEALKNLLDSPRIKNYKDWLFHINCQLLADEDKKSILPETLMEPSVSALIMLSLWKFFDWLDDCGVDSEAIRIIIDLPEVEEVKS